MDVPQVSKITLITYLDLKSVNSGPAHSVMVVARRLFEEGRLRCVICRGYHRCNDLPEQLFRTPPNRIFHKLSNRIISLLCRRLRLNQRLISERLFDYCVSHSACLKETDIALFFKPGFYRSTRMLNKMGKTGIAWASILHPEFNLQQFKKTVATFNMDADGPYSDKKRVEYISNFYEAVNYIIVESNLARDSFIKLGFSKRRIYRLNGGFSIDCQKFKPVKTNLQKKKFSALHISHMSAIKGIGYLLDAWQKLGLPQSELALVGDCDLEIRRLIDRYQLQSLIMPGHVTDTLSWYQWADVFVSPSVADNRPNTILESMATGVPVIASNMCGLSEVISNGVDGFVYQFDSIDELKECITWCHRNPHKLKEMGKAAREKAERFQREDFAHNIISAVSELTEPSFVEKGKLP